MTRSQRNLQLAAYADGELEPSSRPSVEAYIASHAEAAADVESRRRLRSALQRVHQETLVPESLRADVSRLVARERNSRRFRGLRLVAASGFAAAALFMLAVSLGGPALLDNKFIAPPPIAALPVSANSFVQAWGTCSGPTPHDELHAAKRSISDLTASIQSQKLFPRQELVVPDLRSAGYELVGACRTAIAPDMVTLQLTYRDNSSGKRVAMFVSSRPLELQCGGASITHHEAGSRVYQYADLRDNVSVVKWDERYCSVVLCAEAPSADLANLAQKVSAFGAIAMGETQLIWVA